MEPNPRVSAAFIAMAEFGINEKQVKPVLKNLLRLFDRNWELIEEENYRILLDAIFEAEDTQGVEEKEEKKKSKSCDEEDMEEEPQLRREPACPSKRIHSSGDEGSSQNKKSTNADPEDNMGEALTHPHQPERPLKRLRKTHGGQLSPSPSTCNPILPRDIAQSPDSRAELQQPVSHHNSAVGRPDFHRPKLDAVIKLTEEKYLHPYKIIDPNFSLKNLLGHMCESFLELGTNSNGESQDGSISVSPNLDALKKTTAWDSVHGTKESLNGPVSIECPTAVTASQVPRLPLSLNDVDECRQAGERAASQVPRLPLSLRLISDNAGIVEKGNQVRDLLRRHDKCLSAKKALESELTDSIKELKKIEAEELPVKEAEEVARVLRQQYESGRLAVKRRVSDLKASIERQKKLDVELRQSRVDANEGLLPDVGRAEALNKSAEEEILNSIASLLHFCSKPE